MPRAVSVTNFLCTISMVVGVILLVQSITLQPFTDQTAAMDAFGRWCDVGSGHANDSIGEHFYSYWTNKYLFHDIGIGLLAASGALLGLVIGLWRSAYPGMIWVRTPANRWTFLAIGIGVMAWCWAGVIHGLLVDQRRLAFPPCTDTIVIPMIEITALVGVVTPVLAAIGFAITLAFGKLPAPLSQWDSNRPRVTWSVTIITIVITTILILSMISMTTSSSAIGAPGAIAALYLIASTRAAILAPRVVTGTTGAQR